MSAASDLTRRSIVRLFGALMPAAVVSAPAAAVTAPRSPAPQLAHDRALLELGDRLEQLVAALEQATEQKRLARAAFDALCPALPPELVWSGPLDGPLSGELECDVEGNAVHPPDRPGEDGIPRVQLRRRILTASELARAVDELDGRTVDARRARRLLPIARRFERARRLAERRSGILPALEHQTGLARSIEKTVAQIGEHQAETFEGAAVYARALLAVEHACSASRGWAAATLAPPLAAAVVRFNPKIV